MAAKKDNQQSYVKVGLDSISWSLHDLHQSLSVSSYLRYQSVFICDCPGNIPSLYLTVVYELGECMAELRAVRQKMATGPVQAAENEQPKIIFKWALKINCVCCTRVQLLDG